MNNSVSGGLVPVEISKDRNIPKINSLLLAKPRILQQCVLAQIYTLQTIMFLSECVIGFVKFSNGPF